jgi:hypothetical protein
VAGEFRHETRFAQQERQIKPDGAKTKDLYHRHLGALKMDKVELSFYCGPQNSPMQSYKAA